MLRIVLLNASFSPLQELSDLNWLIVGATNTAEGQTQSPSVPVLPCEDLQLTRPTVLVIGEIIIEKSRYQIKNADKQTNRNIATTVCPPDT